MTVEPVEPGGYREHRPSPALAPFVSCFWTRRARAGATTRVLPDGAADIVFDLASPSAAAGVWAVGTMTRPLVFTAPRESVYLGVRFRPGGAHPVFGVPMRELTDTRVELGSIWPQEMASTWWDELGPLRQTGTIQERVCRIDGLLSALLVRCAHPDPRVAAATRHLERARGRVSVERLARHIGVSRQHLTRLFEQHVGIGVKPLTRIIRMQSVLRAALRSDHGGGVSASWADLAVDHGYFDQSHWSNECKALTGLSPTELLRLP